MIGIFDSGIGGLGTMKAIRDRAPSADLVYFGDLANMPYGPRSSEELFELTLAVMRFLRARGATEFVAACNSVSVSVITPILDVFGSSSTRVIEMVGPAARALRAQHPTRVIVAATLATVRSGMYERAFAQEGFEVSSIALPELASAIERDASREEIVAIITPAIEQAISLHADTFVFGCTQYPFVKEIFAEEFAARGYDILLFDPSQAVADETVERFNMQGTGKSIFFVSQMSEVFEKTVKNLFGPLTEIICLPVDKLVDNSVEEQRINVL